MFKRKKPIMASVFVDDGVVIEATDETYAYIRRLKDRYDKLMDENRKLEWELEAIKPIVEKKDLRPAISNKCRDCVFCVRSKYNGDIIGCCKDCVCDDYKPEEER